MLTTTGHAAGPMVFGAPELTVDELRGDRDEAARRRVGGS